MAEARQRVAFHLSTTGASQSAGQIDRMSRSLDRLSRSLDKVEKNTFDTALATKSLTGALTTTASRVQQTERRTRTAALRVRALGLASRAAGALMQAATVTVAALTAGMVALGVSAVRTAADFQMLDIRLRSIAGSVSAAAELKELVLDLARLPTIDIQFAADSIANMEAMGVATEVSERILRGFDAAATAAGKGQQEMARAMLGVNQIIATQQIQGEELRQVMEAGLSPIIKVLRDDFGVTTRNGKELNDVLNNMGITLDEFFGRVADITLVENAEASVESFETLQAAIKNVRLEWTRVAAAVGAPVLEPLTLLLNGVAASLRDANSPLRKMAEEHIPRIIDRLGELVRQLGIFLEKTEAVASKLSRVASAARTVASFTPVGLIRRAAGGALVGDAGQPSEEPGLLEQLTALGGPEIERLQERQRQAIADAERRRVADAEENAEIIRQLRAQEAEKEAKERERLLKKQQREFEKAQREQERIRKAIFNARLADLRTEVDAARLQLDIRKQQGATLEEIRQRQIGIANLDERANRFAGDRLAGLKRAAAEERANAEMRRADERAKEQAEREELERRREITREHEKVHRLRVETGNLLLRAAQASTDENASLEQRLARLTSIAALESAIIEERRLQGTVLDENGQPRDPLANLRARVENFELTQQFEDERRRMIEEDRRKRLDVAKEESRRRMEGLREWLDFFKSGLNSATDIGNALFGFGGANIGDVLAETRTATQNPALERMNRRMSIFGAMREESMFQRGADRMQAAPVQSNPDTVRFFTEWGIRLRAMWQADFAQGMQKMVQSSRSGF